MSLGQGGTDVKSCCMITTVLSLWGISVLSTLVSLCCRHV